MESRPGGLQLLQDASHVQQMLRASEADLSVKEGKRIAGSDCGQSLLPKLWYLLLMVTVDDFRINYYWMRATIFYI